MKTSCRCWESNRDSSNAHPVVQTVATDCAVRGCWKQCVLQYLVCVAGTAADNQKVPANRQSGDVCTYTEATERCPLDPAVTPPFLTLQSPGRSVHRIVYSDNLSMHRPQNDVQQSPMVSCLPPPPTCNHDHPATGFYKPTEGACR